MSANLDTFANGDPPGEIVLIEPASSLQPAERREEWGVLLDHEGFPPDTRVTRLTAFTLAQLAQCPLTVPWRLLDSQTRPGQRLLPLVRLGPRLVAWPLIVAQVVAAVGLLRARRLRSHRAAAVALTPQTAVPSLIFARLGGLRLVVRLQADVGATHSPLTKALLGFVLRRADRVVAVSQFMADVARRARVADDAIRVLSPPIDPAFEGPAAFERKAGVFRVGFLGRLEQEKGCDDLLHAFAEARTDRWSLLVAGRGSQATHLRELAHELGIGEQVEWLGFLKKEDVGRLLGTLHCVAVPTRIEEGFGRVAVEALLRGTPVVAYESGGLREACGPGALFVPRRDVQGFSKALSRFADEPLLRKSLAISGRDHALRYTGRPRGRLNEVIWGA